MRAFASAALALILAALLAGLAACDSGPRQGTGVTPVHSTTPSVAGHRYTPGEFMGAVVAAEKKSGSFQMAMELRADATGALTTADAAVIFDNGDGRSAMDMTMTDLEDRKVSIKAVGGQTYVAVDPDTEGKYVQIDPADTTNPLAPMAAALNAADPTRQAEDLNGAVIKVDLVGDEDMFGVATSHYRVIVDTSKVTGDTAKRLNSSALGKEATYDFWLDSQGRPLQMKYVTEVEGEQAALSIIMRGGGEVQRIVAPTADQLTTLKPVRPNS